MLFCKLAFPLIVQIIVNRWCFYKIPLKFINFKQSIGIDAKLRRMYWLFQRRFYFRTQAAEVKFWVYGEMMICWCCTRVDVGANECGKCFLTLSFFLLTFQWMTFLHLIALNEFETANKHSRYRRKNTFPVSFVWLIYKFYWMIRMLAESQLNNFLFRILVFFLQIRFSFL